MHKLTEEYRTKRESYNDFTAKIEGLIRELLIQNDVNFHKIESRTKNPERLEEKIQRKNEKYENLNDITDIIGIRIICYFEDEVDKIAKIIEAEFELDRANSIDKRQSESDRFGYKSLHYVISLTEHRKKLTEYMRFVDIKIEVQIRSILQHAWAEIEHDIGYKGEHAIPDIFKRNFYRVAALLETADIEFVNIREGLTKYEETVGEVMKNHPEDVEINSASLKSYILNSAIVINLDNQIKDEFELSISETNQHIESYVEKLIFLNINTIKELDNAIAKHKDDIIEFANIWMRDIGKGLTMDPGLSIFYLCYIIVAEKDNIEFANSYYNKMISRGSSRTSEGKRIIETYKKLKSA